jgi:hypothetical protein
MEDSDRYIYGELSLWGSVLNHRIYHALGPFDIPNQGLDLKPSLKAQYELLRDTFRKQGKIIKKRFHLHKEPQATREARDFFMYDEFDEVMKILGDADFKYGRRIFNLVQQGITYEKLLFEEFSEQGRLI